MSTTRRAHFSLGRLLLLTLVTAGQLAAVVVPERSGVRDKEFRHPDLDLRSAFKVPAQLPETSAAKAAADLAALGVPGNTARLDVRSGRWSTLTPSRPLIPGRGSGNQLSWEGLGVAPPANEAALRAAAGQAFRGYLKRNAAQLRIDVGELAGDGRVTVHRAGEVVQIYVPRVVNGVPVRGSYLTAAINHGNLVLFGANTWGDMTVSTVPEIAEDAGLAAVQAHVEPFGISGAWGKTELVLVPMARGLDPDRVRFGRGYTHRLAWVVRPSFDEDEVARYEALVDAHTGELISFEDTAQYATTREVVGGVLPEHNDPTQGPQGTEQAGWPMPYVDVDNAAVTFTGDAGGNVLQCLDGSISSELVGPFMLMNDNCGAINESTTGDVLDFGTSPGTDCNVAPGASPGNTRASRTGFYELNRFKEMARGQLPNNSWLQQQLQANMNINQNCNATWNGQVNFYTSGGGCANTGEVAGIFDHEAGHGMDANDATPGISDPGEGIPDVYAALRLGTSCIGFNFRPGLACGGYGDPCIAFGGDPACTGVRDIDHEKRASQQPHTFTWANTSGTCGSSHCRGAVYAEAVWSLWKRDLPAVYGMDNNTALEVATRLTYIGAGGVGTWFSGSPPFGGCSATGGYLNYLAADDDNGNIADGTPHMQAIYDAFNRQEIACNTPTVQDSGCVGTPATAPVVTATALDRGAELSWGAVAGATEYEVFRTDGVFACDFGKVKVGSTTGTSFVDSGMQNGRDYYYVVIAKGPSDTCFGPASACMTVVPVAGANLEVDAASAAVAITTGDGDDFIDNCEAATVTFDVINIATAAQTNVQIVDIRPSNPGITINTALPVTVTPGLGICATAQGSFGFTAADLSFGETVEFEVDVTSTELGGIVKTGTLVFTNAESDLSFVASQTYDFETDLEGWTLIQGTFNRASAGGGAGGSAWYARTSSNLDNQCDQIRSPAMRLTATSTIEVFTNFDIENQSSPGTWWDRANVAFFENGSRNSVDPDSGRPYNASGAGATCVTVNQNGWAASQPTWASSGFSATALDSAGRAGQTVQIDVAYGTDVSVVGDGFRFDQLTVTDVEFLVADGQSDVCDAPPVCGDGTVDPDEQCDDGNNLPGDCCAADCTYETSGTACGDQGAECLVDDACDGAGACTDNGFEPDGMDCGDASDTSCDNPDSCLAGACQDNFEPDGMDCGDASDTSCDNPDSCLAGACQDNFDPDGTECDDGLFCNENEACDGTGTCGGGTPNLCDDGVGCTDDSCNEGTDSCDNLANDGNCPDDALFCNGTEFCDPALDCSSTGGPCGSGQTCNEGTNTCETSVCDNDGVCETGEDCDTCPADCDAGTTPGAVCGNGVCEAGDGEDCASCPADCNGLQNRRPSNRFCCGDGDGQNPVDCNDSRCTTGGWSCTDIPQPPDAYCCGDLICEAPEDGSSCELDCGPLPPVITMHVGDLDATSATAPRNRWSATVTVTVHDEFEASVDGATVTGSWSAGATGAGSCTTNGAGGCSIAKGNIKGNSPSATFSVTDVTLGPGDIYDSGANHDPDFDSDGTSITVLQP